MAHRRRHRVPRHQVSGGQAEHAPRVSAKAGEAVKRKKYKGAVQGFVVRRLGPAAKKFMDEVVAECEMSEAARKAAASKIMRAIGTEASLMRNEEQFVADYLATRVPLVYLGSFN